MSKDDELQLEEKICRIRTKYFVQGWDGVDIYVGSDRWSIDLDAWSGRFLAIGSGADKGKIYSIYVASLSL